MHELLLPHLRCPACQHQPLSAQVARREGSHILSGGLTCASCKKEYRIEGGVVDILATLAPERENPDTERLGQWFMEQSWFAQAYDRVARPFLVGMLSRPSWLRREVSFLQDAHRVLQKELILDAACGTGRWSRLLARHSQPLQVVAVDISKEMLQQQARQNQEEGLSEQISLFRADVTCLPFADNVFGAGNCFTAFHLFPDLDRAVAELARVMRPGSRFTAMVVSNPGRGLRRFIGVAGEILGSMRFHPMEEVRRILWRHRLATIEEVDGGMVVLLTALLGEERRRATDGAGQAG